MAEELRQASGFGSSGDIFLGYKLRQLEEWQEKYGPVLDRLDKRLWRIEQKVDALAKEMTPEERAAVIAQLNADVSKLTAGSAQLDALAAKLDNTAKEG